MRLRPMPMKPCPPEVIISPWIWTSISSQCANSPAMIAADVGSLAVKFSTVWSENTTPQPNVTPGALRSNTSISWRRIAQLHRDREIKSRRPAADARDLHAKARGSWLSWLLNARARASRQRNAANAAIPNALGAARPRRIAADVRNFAPNVIHVSAPDWLGTGAQRLARELCVPIVASMHTRFETYLDFYGLRGLRRWAVRRQRDFYCASDRVLAPNGASRKDLRAMGVPVKRIGIWSRGVEHELFNPARRDLAWRQGLGYANEDVVLLFFGRIVREKGTACFVETVRELRRRGLAIRPLIVGDGPARAEMAAQIGEAVFLGHLDGADLGRAIASADILLNPSLTEPSAT